MCFNTASGNRVHATMDPANNNKFYMVSIPQAVIGCMQRVNQGFRKRSLDSFNTASGNRVHATQPINESRTVYEQGFNTASGNRVHATEKIGVYFLLLTLFQYRKR